MPYLFSYGSNSPRQLSERLGRPVAGERAYVTGYRRVFRGHSQRWGGGVASLERASQDRVYGYIEKVSEAELATLDRFEGVAGYTTGRYKRLKVIAQTDSQRRDAVAYVSTSDTFTQPTRAYLEAVAETVGTFWTGSSGKKVSWKDFRVNPEEIAMRKKNPAFGPRQPDLFGGDTARAAQTRTHVPISSLTEAQLKAIPRDDYGDDEWEELDPEIQEHIHEHDPASVERVQKLVEPIIEQFKYYEDPDNDLKRQWIDSESESFESWLINHDEPVENRRIRKEVADLSAEITEAIARERTPEEGTPGEDEIRGAINNALREADNYEFEITGNEYGAAFYKSKVSGQQIYIEGDALVEMVKGLHPDEIERAAKEINRETYLNLKAKDLEPRYYGTGAQYAHEFTVDIEPDFYFEATPDWDKIKAAALEELGVDEAALPEVATPPETRIIYRFSDGWYVQDLLSSELPEETRRMGNICVGKPEFGYIGAVKAGTTKIYSLRNKAGKPILTIEASQRMSDEGQHLPPKIKQIKGSGNRLPGWALHKQGKGGYKAMNVDEVKRAVEFIQSLGVDPASVSDLDPARDAVLTYSVSTTAETPDSQFLLDAFLGAEAKENPRRGRNDRPLGFNSPWTP